MHIRTIEEDYEYRMQNILKRLIKEYELNNLNADELYDALWNKYTKEFAHAVIEDMYDFSGDEIFEISDKIHI